MLSPLAWSVGLLIRDLSARPQVRPHFEMVGPSGPVGPVAAGDSGTLEAPRSETRYRALSLRADAWSRRARIVMDVCVADVCRAQEANLRPGAVWEFAPPAAFRGGEIRFRITSFSGGPLFWSGHGGTPDLGGSIGLGWRPLLDRARAYFATTGADLFWPLLFSFAASLALAAPLCVFESVRKRPRARPE
jgi:hypothetical protein